MLRNLERCPHCGKKFIAITPRIASVNRSDGKSFHLMLYSGPDHRKTFRIEVRASGVTAIGTGKTKKEAEQDAARSVLEQLGPSRGEE